MLLNKLVQSSRELNSGKFQVAQKFGIVAQGVVENL